MQYLQFDSSDEDDDNGEVISQCTSAILEPKHALDRSFMNPNLPVFDIKDDLLEMLKNNQVVIITGNTGCGKSTQIPQFIFDQDPTQHNIICSQPRRLAAQTLAYRVSREMSVPDIPSLVGYQVSFDKRLATNTQIFFVTTGILIKLLINNSDKFFSTYTHIIIDEVHERNIEIDFALVIIKNNLKRFPKCKLILMSATISAEKFANYFSVGSISQIDNDLYIEKLIKTFPVEPEPEELKPSDWAMDEEERKRREQAFYKSQDQFKEEIIKREKGIHFLVDSNDKPAEIINIPNNNEFTVKVFHLDQLEEFFEQIGCPQQVTFFESHYNLREAYKIDAVMEITLAILESIIDRQSVQKIQKQFDIEIGSVIIFLPGYSEIIYVKEALEQKFEKQIKIVILHSNVRPTNQELMEASHRQLKIFLSTNIAESSITVPGCVFVIDYCLIKENIYDNETGNENIAVRYCSQSSCNQRAGRVGRVSNGICFRLVPQYFFKNQMRAYPLCEMMRGRLDKVVLELKRHFEKNQNDQKNQQAYRTDIRRFLSTAIDAPQIKSIDQFISNLQKMGALDEEEHLTNLGHFMCVMPLDINLSKFVYLCCIFDCHEPGITVAAILGQRKGIFQYYQLKDKEKQLQTFYDYDNGDEDDILVQLRVFCEWEELFLNFEEESQGLSTCDISRKFEDFGISKLERDYQRLKTVDLQSLRTMTIHKNEIQRRLQGFFEYVPKHFDPYDKDLIFKLKTILAATYIDKVHLISRNNFETKPEDVYKIRLDGFTKIDFQGLSDQHKNEICQRIKTLFEKFQSSKCLQSRNQQRIKIMEAFKERDLQKLKNITQLNQSSWVNNCDYQANSITINLNPQVDINDIQYVVKQLIHFTERFIKRKDGYLPQRFQNPNQMKLSINIKEHDTLESLLIGLGCYINHTGRSSYYNLIDFKKQECSYESINHVSINPEQIRDSYADFLLAYNFRSNSKYIPLMMLTSKLQGQPLWFQTIAAVFSGEARMQFDSDESYFTSIRIEDKFNLTLDHYVTLEDLNLINNLRRNISQYFKSPPSDLFESDDVTQTEEEQEDHQLKKPDLWDELLQLIKRYEKRQKIISLDSECYKKFEFEKQNELSVLRQEVIQSIQTYVPAKGDVTTELDQKIMDKKVQIINDAGVQLIIKTQRLFHDWKQTQITQCKALNFLAQQQNRAIIVCLNCTESYDQLGSMKNVRFLDEDKLILPYLQVNNMNIMDLRSRVQTIEFSITDRYQTCNLSQAKDEYFSAKHIGFLIQKLGLPQKVEDYIFYSCKDQNHIFGIWPTNIPTNGAQKAFIFSETLNLVYPNLKREVFKFRRDNELIFLLEQQSQKTQDYNWRYEKFNCSVCSRPGQPFQAPYSQLQKHLHDHQHKQNMNSLLI